MRDFVPFEPTIQCSLRYTLHSPFMVTACHRRPFLSSLSVMLLPYVQLDYVICP